MLHRYLILHGLQKLIPAKFRKLYPELAVDRRRRRQRSAKGKCSGAGKFTVGIGDLDRKEIEDPKEIPQDYVCSRTSILL